MLKIMGPRPVTGFCDGVSRRSFLSIGALALGGLSMPQLLRAAETSAATTTIKSGGLGHKAIIMIYMPGGPPHQDMYDLKPDAPSEVRGEFKPIKTAVPGIEICEMLPGLARNMDKLVPIRTIVGAKDRHESFQCLTGRLSDNQPAGGWPELGSVISKLQGPAKEATPPFVNLAPTMQHMPYNNGKPGFLGAAHAPFRPEAEGKDDLVLQGITLDRLDDRRALLASVDRFRREADASKAMEGMDAYTREAFGILTSSDLAKALDLSHEPEKLRERYGKGTDKHQGDGAPRINQQFLMARRLVEAGVRCVTISYSFWDFHGQNFKNVRANAPDFDQAMSALVEDLHERGLDQDVTVVVWGEFGRTPKINKEAGRDHWAPVNGALLSGGGMKVGQVIGSTDKTGAYAASHPIHYHDVLATVYHNLGIDPHGFVKDMAGRPIPILPGTARPIEELV